MDRDELIGAIRKVAVAIHADQRLGVVDALDMLARELDEGREVGEHNAQIRRED